jgi:hypothetical protein
MINRLIVIILMILWIVGFAIIIAPIVYYIITGRNYALVPDLIFKTYL